MSLIRIPTGKGARVDFYFNFSRFDCCSSRRGGTKAMQRLARRSKFDTADASTRLALETIAHDEANHASLARDIVAYGLSVGGTSIRRSLRESFEMKRKELEREVDDEIIDAVDDPCDDEAQRYGLPGKDVMQAARIEAWERKRFDARGELESTSTLARHDEPRVAQEKYSRTSIGRKLRMQIFHSCRTFTPLLPPGRSTTPGEKIFRALRARRSQGTFSR